MAMNGKPSPPTLVKPGLTIKHETLLKTERLSSFKLPRDLTLGGSLNSVRIPKNAHSKKVYAPNVNAVRNKNSEVKTSRDTTIVRGRGRGRGERGKSDRGSRGGGRGGTLVQTSGLFSEGTGETHTRKTAAGSSRDKSDINSLRRPTIVKRDIKIDPELEEKNISELLGDLDDHYENGSIDNDYYTPVGLYEIKNEIKNENQFFPTLKKENEDFTYPQNLDDFFGRQQPQLFLLQLPDCLPGEAPTDKPAEKSEASTSFVERSESPDPASRYCTMKHVEEGLIGKIVRYKSGKSKFIIGQTRFDIDLGMDPGLLQEAMSVTTNRTERSGNLINLGQIQAKLNAIPDWDFMLMDKS